MIIVFSVTLFDFSKRAESCLESKSSEKDSAVTKLVQSRRHYAAEIRIFISKVRPTTDTNPSRKQMFLESLSETGQNKFENVGFRF